ERWLGELPEFGGETICLDRDWPLMIGQSEENPERELRSENLAYVIYTSGATGRPKGVGIAHRSTVGLISWMERSFSPEELGGMLGATSLCFDLSVFELLGSLCLGGKGILVGNALD